MDETKQVTVDYPLHHGWPAPWVAIDSRGRLLRVAQRDEVMPTLIEKGPPAVVAFANGIEGYTDRLTRFPKETPWVLVNRSGSVLRVTAQEAEHVKAALIEAMTQADHVGSAEHFPEAVRSLGKAIEESLSYVTSWMDRRPHRECGCVGDDEPWQQRWWKHDADDGDDDTPKFVPASSDEDDEDDEDVTA